MNTRSFRLITIAAVFSASFAAALDLKAADLTLQKVPPLTVEQAPAYPENLARFALGAKIESAPQTSNKLQLSSAAQDKNTAASALLCDDPTVGYALPAGTSSIVVALPSIENVETMAFLNHGAEGKVGIAISSAQLPADSPQWHDVAQENLSSDAVKAKIGPTDAKYVKLTFNVTQPGRIAAFGLYSTPAVSDFTMPRPRKISFDQKSASFALITSNLTDVHAKARALYVSSGSDLKQANNMIDDQPSTSYAFSGDDSSPTAVIDLGKVCTLRRLSAIFSPRKGTVDFYVLNSLPTEAKTQGDQLNAAALQKGAPAGQTPAATAAAEFPESMNISEDVFRNLKPVGSVANAEGEGRASVDFPATSGRYVLVKWNSANSPGTPLSVAEVAAFGGSSNSSQIIASNEDRAAGSGYSDGKTMQSDGKTILDNKDIPAEGPASEPQSPEEGPPPGLPQHPPFTFIPEVVPTSP